MLLKEAFMNLKKHDGFSLRQWSQIVDLSSSYLNLVINSKRLPPKQSLLKLAQSLNFDKLATESLLEAYEHDWLKLKGISSNKDQSLLKQFKEFHTVAEDDSVLLKSWLHLAVLEFSTCENFTSDPVDLAKIFNTSPSNIKIVLFDLLDSGFLIKTPEGQLKKINLKMRVPTSRSREVVRNFHIENLKNAIHHLQTFKDQESFQKRLITGYTVAVNSNKLEEAKLMIEKSMIEIVNQLTDGASEEIYQFQIQLFPLTRKV
ncbi:MAG: TIGR02147 family protein [Bdellovibrio sp.]